MTFNASYTELFSTIIYDFQSLSNVLKHKEPHLRYGRKYVLSSVLSFEKASYYTLNLYTWLMHLIFIPKRIPYFVEYKVRAKNLYFKEDLVGGSSCQSTC